MTLNAPTATQVRANLRKRRKIKMPQPRHPTLHPIQIQATTFPTSSELMKAKVTNKNTGGKIARIHEIALMRSAA
jgi:dsDNA-specific endonuclease/ATPase MutS2